MELTEKPLNREPPVSELVSTFYTSTKNGYDRNHGMIPQIDASKHQVLVDGAVSQNLTLSIPDLQSFPQHTVVCALQCAGNRRHTMRTHLKEVQGLDWFDGAVMNCKWRGPRLLDVLSRAGPQLSHGHVAFASYASECQEDSWYGGSIPLSRALDAGADVILALEMNDAPLEAKHGFPVRVVTPGIAGARAVKWLDRITVQDEESSNHYQKFDYKILPPEATDKESAEKFWGTTPALQEMPVNSVVAVPLSESTVARDAQGLVHCQGYAVPSGENGPVMRVEVSGDGGQTWSDAELIGHPEQGKWSWSLWKAAIKMESGEGKEICSRATDKAGNTQEREAQWNLRGCGYNGYGLAEKLHVV